MTIIHTVQIEIQGKPIAKARPRVDQRTARMYTPTRTIQAEKRVRMAVIEQCSTEIDKWQTWSGMIGLTLVYYMPFMSKLRKAEKIEGSFHVVKPDLDNLVKLTVDAINGYLFRDDSQVAFITARKLQSSEPRTFAEVTYYD